MGGQVSTIPENVDLVTAKSLVGDSWTESMETEFNQLAVEGSLEKSKALELFSRSGIQSRIGGIPQVGLGTYLCSDEIASSSVEAALRLGYRHIDTAEFYANHKGIAEGIKKSGISREDIFITDKFSPGGIFGSPELTAAEVKARVAVALELLGTSYLDLFLIHHPGAKEQRVNQWRALCDLKSEGVLKQAGVSNFSVKHLEQLKAAGLPTPDVNQIEIHPLCTQTELIAYMKENNITVVAYSSLAPATTWRTDPGQGSAKTEEHTSHLPTVHALMGKYGVSEAQLLLRWAIQHGYVILPKSSKAERIAQNTELFHFAISADDMTTLDKLDTNTSLAWPTGNPLDWD